MDALKGEAKGMEGELRPQAEGGGLKPRVYQSEFGTWFVVFPPRQRGAGRVRVRLDSPDRYRAVMEAEDVLRRSKFYSVQSED